MCGKLLVVYKKQSIYIPKNFSLINCLYVKGSFLTDYHKNVHQKDIPQYSPWVHTFMHQEMVEEARGSFFVSAHLIQDLGQTEGE